MRGRLWNIPAYAVPGGEDSAEECLFLWILLAAKLQVDTQYPLILYILQRAFGYRALEQHMQEEYYDSDERQPADVRMKRRCCCKHCELGGAFTPWDAMGCCFFRIIIIIIILTMTTTACPRA